MLFRRAPFLLVAIIAIQFGRGCPLKTPSQPSPPEAKDFLTRLQKYVEATGPLRKSAADKVPAGGDAEAQAVALQKRREVLADSIRTLRSNAGQSDLFTPEVTAFIRKALTASLMSSAASAVRDALEEQNDPAIYKDPRPQVAINSAIAAPLVPGVLLPDLPPLPEQVEYRFVGRALVLVDRETPLVLDFIPDALPEPPPVAKAEREVAAPRVATRNFLRMPRKSRSVRFAVIGDSGTGDDEQVAVADTLWSFYEQDNRFRFVLMLGDNLYAGFEGADDYRRQFLIPYKRLLDARVQFRATLGNHDQAGQVDFAPFNMGGRDYYSFEEGNATFVALNSNNPQNARQLAWLVDELEDEDGWRICFFHHPLYSSGQHARESRDMRQYLEEHLVKSRVNVVFGGHEHFYERSKPQKSIQYFVSGAAAKLRRNDLKPQEFTAFGYDLENSFMVVEIAGDELFFQAIGVSGRTIDCGVFYRTADAATRGAAEESTQAWLQSCAAARQWLKAKT